MRYYYIEINNRYDNKLPYFIGSMVRGAFGHALKRVTCVNHIYVCDGCVEAKNCLYYDFFEKKNIPHSYRLDTSLGNNDLNFGIYLFQNACEQLPYILSSIEKALVENGLGKERTLHPSFIMSVNGQTVYEKSTFTNRLDMKPYHFNAEGYITNIKIKFLTPLRIKKSSTLEYDNIKPEDILRSIYQRKKWILEEVETYKLPYQPSYSTFIKALDYKPLYRRSDRQNKAIVMDGVLGEMIILGIDKRSYDLFRLGEIIGVGKQTVFGLGKIKIEEVK